jgi:tetratricopeptide (TPR) repeat protein
MHRSGFSSAMNIYKPRTSKGLFWLIVELRVIYLALLTHLYNCLAVDPRSHRAWYGLGQLYEILKLPAYALYYYQQAVKCKPTDSRMLVATGVVLAKLKRVDDAEKCFKKAFQIGDVEGNALIHLGR